MNTISHGEQNSPGGFRSPSQNKKATQVAHKFNEGALYKQVVTFQSGRGKLFNDSAILKNSINQVQRRSDRETFMRNKFDDRHHSRSKNSHGSGGNSQSRPAFI